MLVKTDGPSSLGNPPTTSPLRRGQDSSSSSSVRLRKKRDVVKEEFKKNRTSGEFGYFSAWQGEKKKNKRQSGDWCYMAMPSAKGEEKNSKTGLLRGGFVNEGDPGDTKPSMETLDRKIPAGPSLELQSGANGVKMRGLVSPLSQTDQYSLSPTRERRDRNSLYSSPTKSPSENVKLRLRTQSGNRRDNEDLGEEKKQWRRSASGICQGKTQYKEFGPIDFPPDVDVKSTKSSHGTKADRGRIAGLGRRSATQGEIRRNVGIAQDKNGIYGGCRSQENIPQALSSHEALMTKNQIASYERVDKILSSQETPKEPIYSHKRGVSSLDKPVSSHDRGVSSPQRGISSHDRGISSHARGISSNDRGISSHGKEIPSHDKPLEPQLDFEQENSTLKKGTLWQQKDKLFSRWKERFFILTKDYLQCFKKGTSRITEMGAFIFKIKLNDVESLELIDKRGYLTISLLVAREGKMLLRKPEGIREWYNTIKDCTRECQERTMKSTEDFWNKRQFTDSSNIEQWLLARHKIGLQYAYSDSTPAIPKSVSEHTALSSLSGPQSAIFNTTRSDRSPGPDRPQSAGPRSRAPARAKKRGQNAANRTSYLHTDMDNTTMEPLSLQNIESPEENPYGFLSSRKNVFGELRPQSLDILNSQPTTQLKSPQTPRDNPYTGGGGGNRKEDQFSQDSGNDSLNTNTSTGGSRGSSDLGPPKQNQDNFIKGENGNIYEAPVLASAAEGRVGGTSGPKNVRRQNMSRRSHLPHQATQV